MAATVAKLRNLNYIIGDVVAEHDDGWYQVSIRGSQGKQVRARRDDLLFLSDGDAAIEVEKKRRVLFDSISHDSPKHLKERALAVELAEEVMYLIAKNSKKGSDDSLPEAVEHKVHARFVEAYYTGQGKFPTHGHRILFDASFSQSMAPFLLPVPSDGSTRSLHHGNTAGVADGSIRLLRTSGTTGSMVELFERLVLQDPSNSARLFFRAMAYAEFVQKSIAEPEDSLLDAFMLTFAAIQALQGNMASLGPHKTVIEQSVDSFFANYGIDIHERLSQHKIPTSAEPGFHMNHIHLLWCLCHKCLTVGFVMRDKLIPQSMFEFILPNPFGCTTDEQLKIGTYLIDSRPENPTSYWVVHDMILDVKDFRHPDTMDVWLEK